MADHAVGENKDNVEIESLSVSGRAGSAAQPSSPTSNSGPGSPVVSPLSYIGVPRQKNLSRLLGVSSVGSGRTRVKSNVASERFRSSTSGSSKASSLLVDEEEELSMDMRNLQLRTFPPSLYNVPMCVRLNLSRNLITELPLRIGIFRELQYLDMSYNLLVDTLPPTLSKCMFLTHLTLSGNKFKTIPSVIGDLKCLKYLRMSSVGLEDLECLLGLKNWPKLLGLDVSDNQISVLPGSILLEAKCLVWLFLGYNQISTIPSEIGYMKSIESIRLDYNNIVNLPDNIDKLTSLGELTLGHNQLVGLPPKLATLGNLCNLGEIAANPIRNVPHDILSRGAKRIFKYLKDASLNGTSAVHRANVLFLGNRKTGKSTIFERGCAKSKSKQKKPNSKGASVSLSSSKLKPKRMQVTGKRSKAKTAKFVELAPGLDRCSWISTNDSMEFEFTGWDIKNLDVLEAVFPILVSSWCMAVVVWNTAEGDVVDQLDVWLSYLSRHCPNVSIVLVGTHMDSVWATEDRIKSQIDTIEQKFSTCCNIARIVVGCMTKGGTNKAKNYPSVADMCCTPDQVIGILGLLAYESRLRGRDVVPNPYVLLDQSVVQVEREKRNPPLMRWLEWKQAAHQCSLIQEGMLLRVTEFLRDIGSICYVKGVQDNERLVVLDPQFCMLLSYTLCFAGKNMPGSDEPFTLSSISKNTTATSSPVDEKETEKENEWLNEKQSKSISLWQREPGIVFCADLERIWSLHELFSEKLFEDFVRLLQSFGLVFEIPLSRTSIFKENRLLVPFLLDSIPKDEPFFYRLLTSGSEVTVGLGHVGLDGGKRPVHWVGRDYVLDAHPVGLQTLLLVRLMKLKSYFPSWSLDRGIMYWRNGLLLVEAKNRVFLRVMGPSKLNPSHRVRVFACGANPGELLSLMLRHLDTLLESNFSELWNSCHIVVHCAHCIDVLTRSLARNSDYHGRRNPESNERENCETRFRTESADPSESSLTSWPLYDILDAVRTKKRTKLCVLNQGGKKVNVALTALVPEITFLENVNAHDLIIGKRLGAGSFTTVHEAKWNGKDVAVKIFGDLSDKSWNAGGDKKLKKGLQKDQDQGTDTGNGSLEMPLMPMDQGNPFRDFIAEVSLMKRLRHRTVSGVLGISLSPPILVTHLATTDLRSLLGDRAGGLDMELTLSRSASGSLRLERKRERSSTGVRGASSAEMQGKKDSLYDSPKDAGPLTKSMQWTWSARTKIALDVALSLQFLHSLAPPVVHRDVKPDNILVLVSEGHNGVGSPRRAESFLVSAQLADFGVSCEMVESIQSRRTWNPLHCAPEVMKGLDYTEKADIYSFGMVLWELVTCKVPFEELNFNFQVEEAVISGHRPDIPADCPQALAHLVSACWRSDPIARPTAAALVERLQEVLAEFRQEEVKLGRAQVAPQFGNRQRTTTLV